MQSRPVIAVACLIFGAGAGWTMRPVLSPPSPPASMTVAAVPTSAAIPTQEEATDAVRRHPAGIASLAHAGVTLGSCDPESGLAQCVVEPVWDDRRLGPPQRRMVTFGRISDRWEVAIW